MTMRWQTLDLPLLGLDQRSAPPLARGALELVNYEFDVEGGLRQRRGTSIAVSMSSAQPLYLVGRTGAPLVVVDGGGIKAVTGGTTLSDYLGWVSPVTIQARDTVASFDRPRAPTACRPDGSNYLTTWHQEAWATPGSFAFYDSTVRTRRAMGSIGAGFIFNFGGGPITTDYVGPVRWAENGYGIVAVGYEDMAKNIRPFLCGARWTGSAVSLTQLEAAGVEVPYRNGFEDWVACYDCDGLGDGYSWVAVAYYDLATNNVILRTYRRSDWAQLASVVVGAGHSSAPYATVSTWTDGVDVRIVVLYGTSATTATAKWYNPGVTGTGLTYMGGSIPDRTVGPTPLRIRHLACQVTSATEVYLAATAGSSALSVHGDLVDRAQMGLAARPVCRPTTSVYRGIDVWQPVAHHYPFGARVLHSALDSLWACIFTHEQPWVGGYAGPMPVLAWRGVAYGPTEPGSLPRLADGTLVPQATLQMTGIVQDAQDVAEGTYTTGNQATNVSLGVLDWDFATWMRSANIGSYTLFSGGSVGLYDGAWLAEAGWAWRPEYPLESAAAGASAYAVRNTYAWWDATGALHLSQPSPVWTDAAAASPFTYNPANMTLSRRQGLGSRGTTIKWRTTAGGLVYHRLSSAPWDGALTPDSTTFYSGPLTDTVADAALAARAQLYTDSGALPHVAPPSARFVAVHQDRVWLAGCEQENEVWFSHKLPSGVANASDWQRCPSFSPALTLRTDSPAVAVASVADKAIIFCERDLYAVAGDGPDRNGAGTFLSQKIATEVGVNRPLATVGTPAGAFFVTSRGLYLVDNALTVVPVGAPVQPLLDADDDLRSPIVIPEQHQVLWVRPTSRDVLLYDWLVGQWARWVLWTNVTPGYAQYAMSLAVLPSGAVWAGVRAATTTYQLRTFTAGTVADAGASPGASGVSPAYVQTPWLHFGGLVGWQRTRKLGIVGKNLAGAVMSAAFFSNYASVADSTPALTLPAGARHAVFRAVTQKADATSVKFTITQDAALAPHELWGLTAELGVIGGLVRRPDTEKR